MSCFSSWPQKQTTNWRSVDLPSYVCWLLPLPQHEYSHLVTCDSYHHPKTGFQSAEAPTLHSHLRCYGNSGLSRRPMQQMTTKSPAECVMYSCLCVQQVSCCLRSSWGQNTAKRTFCSGWPAKTTRRFSAGQKWRPPPNGSTSSLCRSTHPDRWGFHHLHTESPLL